MTETQGTHLKKYGIGNNHEVEPLILDEADFPALFGYPDLSADAEATALLQDLEPEQMQACLFHFTHQRNTPSTFAGYFENIVKGYHLRDPHRKNKEVLTMVTEVYEKTNLALAMFMEPGTRIALLGNPRIPIVDIDVCWDVHVVSIGSRDYAKSGLRRAESAYARLLNPALFDN